MAKYNPRKLPAVLTKKWLDDEFTSIASAHNVHDQEDFPAKCVPLRALQNQYGVFCAVLQSNKTFTANEVMYYPITFPCTLVGYSAAAFSVTNAPTFTIAGDTLGTAVAATLFTSSAHGTLSGLAEMVPGDYVTISIDCQTTPGGVVERAVFTLWFKAKHTI